MAESRFFMFYKYSMDYIYNTHTHPFFYFLSCLFKNKTQTGQWMTVVFLLLSHNSTDVTVKFNSLLHTVGCRFALSPLFY